MNVSKQTRAGLLAVLLAAMLVVALAITGCGSKGASKSTLTDSQKAMVESVAKWYEAQGKLDVKGYKDGIYDPNNILGVATMTAPPKEAKETTVTWSWQGDNVVILIPAQQATITVAASPTAKNTVTLSSGPNAGTDSIVMTEVAGVWKIDVNATQQAAAAQQSGGSGTTTKTP